MAAITRTCESQELILGQTVRQFEGSRRFVLLRPPCHRMRFRYRCADVGVDGLRHRARRSGAYGTFAFFATAGTIAQLGAKPVLVDVDPDTFNIDVRKAVRMIESNDQIRAVIPVHLYGGCADMDPLWAAAKSRGIPVIEDAAQIFGASYHGRTVGSAGDAACFSFYPTKNLGAFGDAGLVTTNDPAPP